MKDWNTVFVYDSRIKSIDTKESEINEKEFTKEIDFKEIFRKFKEYSHKPNNSFLMLYMLDNDMGNKGMHFLDLPDYKYYWKDFFENFLQNNTNLTIYDSLLFLNYSYTLFNQYELKSNDLSKEYFSDNWYRDGWLKYLAWYCFKDLLVDISDYTVLPNN